MNKLSELALRGLIVGSVAATGAMASSVLDSDDAFASGAKEEAADGHYKEVHTCAGLNVCKGLGGCKVTQAKLEKLAKKRGIPLEKAGKPHDCAGLNECKGLGGCSVSAEKFKKLKKKLAAKKAGEAAGAGSGAK